MEDRISMTGGTGSVTWGSPSEAAAAADQAEPETVEEERYQLPPSQFEIPNTQALDNESVRRLEHPHEFTNET